VAFSGNFEKKATFQVIKHRSRKLGDMVGDAIDRHNKSIFKKWIDSATKEEKPKHKINYLMNTLLEKAR
jgi:hypothetical protein